MANILVIFLAAIIAIIYIAIMGVGIYFAYCIYSELIIRSRKRKLQNQVESYRKIGDTNVD
ncbi:hypothetical protein FACS1894208_05060 [Clostridia bacterium]|nr:hypothetical protein FACS1894208_05060 [Clostridia bacterium]